MLFLGVDGGQSSTTAVIGDETGRVLGRGQGGPSNRVDSESGGERFKKAVSDSLAAAAAAAGLKAPVEFAAACFGFSGGPAGKRDVIASLVRTQQLEITDDAVIALLGATSGAPGIIVISGTGSIAYGQNAAGRGVRAGGWGYIFGDEGSGFDIVRQALRAALRHEEGWGPSTILGDRLRAATGASTVHELLHWFYTGDYPHYRIASYAPLVDAAALEGDTAARNLLQQAAQHLATLVANVRSQLFAKGEPVPIATVGGVFRSKMLAEWFRILVELEQGATVGSPRHDPACGALLAAYRKAGLSVALAG